MRTYRLWRLAAACRLATLVPFTLSATWAAAGLASAADRVLTGIISDQSGQTVPRAFVRVVDRSGAEAATTFADELGRFRVTAPDGCRIEVSLSGFERAQSACDAPQPLRLTLKVAPVQESVLVTATRTEAPSSQIGASVTIFTADDIERRQVPLVADLLRATPGVMVVRAGAPGAVTSLFVRGGESNYNKVLLDGIPLNEPGGTFNFSNLSTDNLERIEFVRGAHSALFGSDAMASVVQLFTKRPDRSKPRPQAMASIEGGSYNTIRGGAAVSGAAGGFDYALGAQGYSTDNRVPNSNFENTTLSANIGVALPHDASLRFIGRGELEHVGTPGQTAFGRPDLDAFFERHDGVGGVSFDQQLTKAFRQRAAYSLTSSNYQSTNLILDPPYTPRFENRAAPFQFSDFAFDSRTKLHRYHASYQADWQVSTDASHGSQLLTVLADWDGERARLENKLAATETNPSRNNFGSSIQYQALWRRAFLTAGGRVEHNDSFGTAFVPRGSFVFVARTGEGAVGETRLRTSAGLGIKEPTLLESFSPSPFFLGNPDLKPERSRTIEAGVEQRLAANRAKVELTWFNNRYKDRVSTRTTNPATFEAQYFNIGLSRASGAEAAVEVAPVKAFRGRAGYTFLDSEVLESTAPNNVVLRAGQWMFRRPRHSGFAGATVVWHRFTADVTGVFIGRFVDSDFSSLQPPILENPGYTTWDARFVYALPRQVNVLLSIDNLANANYMEPLGYQALQRAVRVGIRVGF
jgi:outer membrane cobalamin receptor